MRIAIIGAGIAGLSCARQLEATGHRTSLFDKGRGPGGRMATRRIDTDLGQASFDHGAQYLTARDPDFVAQVDAWAEADVVARWPAAGADAWVGTPAMNSPVKTMAIGRDVAWGARVEEIVRADAWRLRGDGLDAGPFDAIVVAVPAEQARPLLAAHAPALAELAGTTASAPCWTVMAAFARPVPGDDIVRDAGPIGWAARNSAKPRRTGPESWVIQAGPAWSKVHLEESADEVAGQLLSSLAGHAGGALPPTVALTAHRWRFARSGALGRDFLWDADSAIGVCGDWLLGPRVESAWLSGRRLAGAIGVAG